MKKLSGKIWTSGRELTALLLVLCIAASGIGLILSGGGRRNAGASEPVWEGSAEMAGSYYVGHSLQIPEMSFTLDGSTVTATHKLSMPDGSETTAKTVTLSALGKYRLVYSAALAGKDFEKEIFFNVYEELYTFTGIGNTATYGKYKPDAAKKGLVLSMTQNSSITFNGVIDLNGMTAADPIFEMFVTPTVLGKEDFGKMMVTLTDIYDSENVVTIRFRDSASGEEDKFGAYALAGGPNQALTGYEPSWGRTHRNNEWGSYLIFSFYGARTPVENEVISLRMDYASKTLYSQKDTKLIDLDDPEFFSTLWKGFTTGEARLTLSPDSFVNERANFVITELAGYNLSANAVLDTAPPEITLDFEGNIEANPPAAKTGMPYKLFTASAFDKQSGDCAVTAKVYKNRGLAGETEITVTDNHFTPAAEGVYTIVYNAQDAYGNVAEKAVAVTAKTSVPKTQVSAFSAGRVTTGFVGMRIPVAGYSTSGGSGKISVKISVVGIEESFEVTEGSFLPMTDGRFTVLYEARDYLGQLATYTYSVNISYSNDPIFLSEATLPANFISGHTYVLPELPAYKYTTAGTTVTAANISVKIDNASEITLGAERKIYMETTSETGKAVITYSAGGQTKVYERSVINVKKPDGKLKIENYFICDSGVTKEVTSGSVLLSATKDAGFSFVRELLGEAFTMGFDADTAKTRFDALSFYLTDAVNPENVIKVRYRNTTGTAMVSINDGAEFAADAGFTTAAKSNEFSLKMSGRSVTVGNVVNKLSANLAGKPFTAFETGMILLRAEFENVRGTAGVAVKNINGQPFNGNLTKDNIAPGGAILGDVSGTYKEGDRVTLPAAIAADVLDPNIDFSLTVTFRAAGSESSVTMKDTSGKLLEKVDPSVGYELQLTKCGTVNILYSMADKSNAREEYMSYNLIVQDTTGPVIKLGVKAATAAKLGDAVIIPKATATDDSGEKITVYTYLVTTKGKLIEITGSTDSFTADSKGTYVMRYLAFDSTGNMTILDCPVVVK